jgi:hypothetical protein
VEPLVGARQRRIFAKQEVGDGVDGEVLPVQPGREDELRGVLAGINGPRKRAVDESRRRAGVRELVYDSGPG